MNLEIVEVSSCKKNLVAEVPPEQVEEEITKLARKYALQAKIPGFRPGKVPLHIIRQRYGTELRDDVTHEIIKSTWQRAVVEHGLEPLTEPAVEKVESQAGQPLKFVLSFEVLPRLEVNNYTGIAVTNPPVEVQDGDVDAALENLRQQHAQFVPVENGIVQDGHYVTIHVDGEFEAGGKPIHEENATFIVGGSQPNQEFSENLLGARIDEDRSFEVVYPENHRQKRLAGKKVFYRVKIKEIKEKQVQELSDDFARDLGSSSLQELRGRIRDDLVTKAKNTAEEKAREAVLEQIVQRLAFDVPESMVRNELEAHARRIAGDLARQGIDVSKTSIDWKKIFDEERPYAEKSVRHRLVLEAIARRENLEVAEEEVDAEFKKMAQTSGKSAAALRAQFEKDQRLQAFRMFLLQNKALDFIYRNATISEG